MRVAVETPRYQEMDGFMDNTNQNAYPITPEHDDSGVSSYASSSLTINTAVNQYSRDRPSPNNEFAVFQRPRRQTVMSRMPVRSKATKVIPETVEGSYDHLDGNLEKQGRKESDDSCLGDSVDDSEENFNFVRTTYQRRMSVPASAFKQANYAILRQCDRSYDIVATFGKNTQPYQAYLKSLTAYDLTQNHAIVPMIHKDLSVHKAVKIFCENGYTAALICHPDKASEMAIFTVSDCMKAIYIGQKKNKKLDEMKLSHFMEKYDMKRKLMSVDPNITAWDLARMFVANKVRRVPVFEYDKMSQNCLSFVTLRHLFNLTVAKILDNRSFIFGDLTKWTLKEKDIGVWCDIESVNENSTVKETLEKLVSKSLSAVPVLNELKQVVGVINKGDILEELGIENKTHAQLMETKVSSIIKRHHPPPLATKSTVISDAIEMLLKSSSHMNNIFTVDFENKLTGVVSYYDLMGYILSLQNDTRQNGSIDDGTTDFFH
uniref:CBS domain-containing protein n=1 Tax=Rhabditophanes sp. KR3021 TaxID=114890 RepID=A0AC35UAV4_9BILA